MFCNPCCRVNCCYCCCPNINPPFPDFYVLSGLITNEAGPIANAPLMINVNGEPHCAMTNSQGIYSYKVHSGNNAVVTPILCPGQIATPGNYTFNDIHADHTGLDFVIN